MWQDKLKEIIYILENSNVNEIEIKSWGHQYRVVKNSALISNGVQNLEQPIVVGKQEVESQKDSKKEDNLTALQSNNGRYEKRKGLITNARHILCCSNP